MCSNQRVNYSAQVDIFSYNRLPLCICNDPPLRKGSWLFFKGALLDLPLEKRDKLLTCSRPGCTQSIVYHIQQNPACFPDHGLVGQTIQGVYSHFIGLNEGILFVYPLALHGP